MRYYICIDGGTTNTRLSLLCDGKIIDTVKFSVGARRGIDNKSLLKDTVRSGIETLLNTHELACADVERILASGMITSEFGLVDLPHIQAPAGIKELHDSAFETVLDDISEIPFVFIRGVKTVGNCLETTDMMRGEETELMGLFEGAGVYVLPGSHSKVIKVDALGRIVSFKTMLTGEMISALSQNTILKDAVSLNGKVNEEYLIKGYDYAKTKGLNEALFKVRVLKNLFSKNADEVYSFFMGAVLCDEVISIAEQSPEKVIIGGNNAIKEAEYLLLRHALSADIKLISDGMSDSASCMGMLKIYEA